MAGAAARSRWRGLVCQRGGPVSLRRRRRRGAHRPRCRCAACVRSRPAPVGRHVPMACTACATTAARCCGCGRGTDREASHRRARDRGGARSPPVARRRSATACAVSTRPPEHVEAFAKSLVAASLPENSISELMLDRGGALWVGGAVPRALGHRPARARASATWSVPTRATSASARSPATACARSFEDNARRLVVRHRWRRACCARGAGLRICPKTPGCSRRVPGTAGCCCCGRWPSRRRRGHIAWVATTRGLARLDTRTGVASEVPHPRPSGRCICAAWRATATAACGSARRPRACCTIDPATGACAVHGSAEGDRASGACGPRRSARPRLGRHQRRPRPARSRRRAALRVFRHVAGPARQPRPATSCARCWKAADGTHLDRHALRPEPRARIRRRPIRSNIRSRPRSGERPVPVVFSIAESPQRRAVARHRPRPDALRSRASDWCAATA